VLSLKIGLELMTYAVLARGMMFDRCLKIKLTGEE